jgi:hypothetical protein
LNDGEGLQGRISLPVAIRGWSISGLCVQDN